MDHIFKIVLISVLLSTNAYAKICESKSLVESVLKQAKIDSTEGDLMDCKLDPQNDSKVIMAYAKWLPDSEDEYSGHYVLNLLQFNQLNQRLIDQFQVVEPLISDAVHLNSIQLDTANYKFTNTNRALGLRLDYSLNSSVNPFSMTLLNLYDLKKKRQILHNLIVERNRAEMDRQCNAELEERTSVLVMQKLQSNQAFDILLKSRIEQSVFHGTRDNCKELKQPTSLQNFMLKFDGQQYQIPKRLKEEYQY